MPFDPKACLLGPTLAPLVGGKYIFPQKCAIPKRSLSWLGTVAYCYSCRDPWGLLDFWSSVWSIVGFQRQAGLDLGVSIRWERKVERMPRSTPLLSTLFGHCCCSGVPIYFWLWVRVDIDFVSVNSHGSVGHPLCLFIDWHFLVRSSSLFVSYVNCFDKVEISPCRPNCVYHSMSIISPSPF